MKTNNTPKINSHKASKIPKPLHPFPLLKAPQETRVFQVFQVFLVFQVFQVFQVRFWTKKTPVFGPNRNKNGVS